MGVKYVVIAVLASAITVFALQNSTPTTMRFLVWRLDEVPLATVVLAATAAGMVLVGLPLWIDRWRLRSRARILESRLQVAESLPKPRGDEEQR
jgi:uncharacterized integral membrane protein